MRTQRQVDQISTAISLISLAMGFSVLGLLIVAKEHHGGASITGGIISILLGAAFLMAACLHWKCWDQIRGGLRKIQQQPKSLLKRDDQGPRSMALSTSGSSALTECKQALASTKLASTWILALHRRRNNGKGRIQSALASAHGRNGKRGVEAAPDAPERIDHRRRCTRHDHRTCCRGSRGSASLVRHGALITAGESPALLNRERTRSTE